MEMLLNIKELISDHLFTFLKAYIFFFYIYQILILVGEMRNDDEKEVKDWKQTLQKDEDTISFSQVDPDYFYILRVTLLQQKKQVYLPQHFKNRSLYILTNLGDIKASFISYYNKIIHHNEDVKTYSLLLLDFLSTKIQELQQEFKKENYQGNLEQFLKAELLENKSNAQEVKIYQDCLKYRKNKPKSGKSDLKMQEKDPIIAYLKKESSEDDLETEKEQYFRYMQRNLKLLQKESKEMREKIFFQNVELLRPMFDFHIFKEPTEKDFKYALFENRDRNCFRFYFQNKQIKVLRQEEEKKEKQKKKQQKGKVEFKANISLEDLILSLKHNQVKNGKTEKFFKIKQQLLEKLCKHISWELYLFEKYSGFEYPELNPMTVLFNIEKEFFFLSSEPVIIRHLLGYKNRPTTKANFFQGERFKKIQALFKAPQQYKNDSEEQIIHITNTSVYRLIRLLSSLDELQMNDLVKNHKKIFFKRNMDDSPSCKELFGNFASEKLGKVLKQTKKKNDPYGPSLTRFVHILYPELIDDKKNQEPLQSLVYKNWLRGRIFRLLTKITRKKYEKQKEKQKKQKQKSSDLKRIYLLKIAHYMSLLWLVKSQELMFVQEGERKQIYNHFFEHFKYINISQAIDKVKTLIVEEEEGKINTELKDIKSKLAEFILHQVQSEQNKWVLKNFQTAMEEQIQIVFKDSEKTFEDLYKRGKLFIEEEKVFCSTKTDVILYELGGRVSSRKTQEAVQIYEKFKQYYQKEEYQKQMDKDELKQIHKNVVQLPFEGL